MRNIAPNHNRTALKLYQLQRILLLIGFMFQNFKVNFKKTEITAPKYITLLEFI